MNQELTQSKRVYESPYLEVWEVELTRLFQASFSSSATVEEWQNGGEEDLEL